MQIEDDLSRPEGGHALLILPGRAGDSESPLRVTVRRFREADPCLGPNGWQPGEHRFKPRRIEARGADLVLTLGPRIVDEVEEFTSVEVGVPDLGLAETLHWPALRPSSGLPGAGLDEDMEDEEEAPPPPPPEPTEPAAQDEGLADEGLADGASLLERKEEAPEPVEPETEPAAETSEPPAAEDEPEKRGSAAKWALWGGIAALLIAVAVAAFLLIPDEEPLVEEDTTEETAEVPEEEVPDEEVPADETPADEAEEERAEEDRVPPPDPPFTGTPSERHDEALAALEAGDEDKAVRLLRENADEEDYGPSLVSLGEYYCARDAGEALQLFARACQAEAEGAPAALESCAARVENAANLGDAAAEFIVQFELPATQEACQ